MKKVGFITLLGSLFLLSACGTSSSTNMSSSSIAASSTSTSEKDSSTTNKTSSSSIAEESSSIQNLQTQESVSSEAPSQPSSETTAPSTSVSSSDENSVFTPEQNQALQVLLTNKPELDNPDVVFAFFKMIGPDYLFKATSVSIRQQGGSGTLGFYRVPPDGTVTATDPSGNPI